MESVHGTMTISPVINGFDETFEDRSADGPNLAFEAPAGHQSSDGDAVDVLITVMRGPMRDGKVIDEDLLDDTILAQVVPSGSSDTANFRVTGCDRDFARHLVDRLDLVERTAPSNTISAIDQLLRTGSYDYQSDEGSLGTQFHPSLEPRLRATPIAPK